LGGEKTARSAASERSEGGSGFGGRTAFSLPRHFSLARSSAQHIFLPLCKLGRIKIACQFLDCFKKIACRFLIFSLLRSVMFSTK